MTVDSYSQNPKRPLIDEPELPNTFAPFFVLGGEGLRVNTMYAKAAECTQKIDTFSSAITKIPPMIVACRAEDIALSQERDRYVREYVSDDDVGMPIVLQQWYRGLESYYFFPNKDGVSLYVFDNHSHVLFAWQEAIEAGLLKCPLALIRIDAHTDLAPASQRVMLDSRESIRNDIISGDVDIENFTEPAIRSGMISEMYFYSGTPLVDLNNKTFLDKHSADDKNFQTILKYKERFFDITSDLLREPQTLIEYIRRLKGDGKSVILDIDFDVFEERPSDTENVKVAKEHMRTILPEAALACDLVTCATSPLYANQDRALAWVREFIAKILH